MTVERTPKEIQLSEAIKVVNADCMDVLANIPDNYFDLAIVDPPYGIGANKMTLGNGKNKIYRGQNDWDAQIPTKEYFDELNRVSKNQIVWGGNYMTEYLGPTGAWLFWDKGTGENDFADGELAWTSYKGALRKITKSWVGANAKNGSKRIHPTEKPVYLYGWIINRFCKEGFKILDTHLGSGTHMIAAHYFGVKEFLGIEKDGEYFESSIKAFRDYIEKNPKEGQKQITGTQTNIFQFEN